VSGDEPGDDDERIARAVEVLRGGGLVAFPTETVYGLGADAEDRAALRRLFAAKGRPADHPVIVHLARAGQLGEWAARVPPEAERLAARFWPGPLTLIVPRAARVPDEVTGGQDTVGLRVPAHPLAHALLASFGGGIAAPSANRFGRLSPTRAEHVREELGPLVDLILDGGPCEVGVESTIVACVGPRPLLLRPGVIGAAELAEVLGAPPEPPTTANAPRASGTLPSHYAPATPLELVPAARLRERASELVARGERIALVTRDPHALPSVKCMSLSPRPTVFARRMYAALRELDAARYDRILVEEPPDEPPWAAVADRLRRAAHRE